MGRPMSTLLEEVNWTDDDIRVAYAEGWFYLPGSSSRHFVQKVDNKDTFKTDEEAYNHVLKGKSPVTRKILPLLLRGRFR